MAVVSLWIVVVAMVTGFLAWILGKLIPFLLWYKKLHRAMSKFPHRSPKHWLLGNVRQIGSPEGYLKFVLGLMSQHKRAAVIWFPLNPKLFVFHPDTIKLVIKNTENKPESFLQKGYAIVEPWIGDGLLISKGQKWERNRKLLTPAFHFDILKPYVKLYQEAAEKCVANFKRLAESGEGSSIEVAHPLGLCTLDVMLTCALSFRTDLQLHGHPYEKAVERLTSLILVRLLNPKYILDIIWNNSSPGKEYYRLCDYAHEISGNVIRARQESMQKEPDSIKKRHLDFLDILLTAKDESGLGLTFREIRDEVDTFLFEGHDTTKTALTFSLYCLGKYPKEQQKVWEEICEVCGEKDSIEWEDIQQLQYMGLFLKEVLRFYPPVPHISRQSTKPFVIEGVEMPADTQFELHIYSLHHNPYIWKNPETFDTSRFLPENVADRDPYCYIPFSASSRNCIGQVFAMNEIKTVLACLVKRFEFHCDWDHEKNIVLQSVATLKAKHGVKIKVLERQH